MKAANEGFNQASPVAGPTYVDATSRGKRIRRGLRLLVRRAEQGARVIACEQSHGDAGGSRGPRGVRVRRWSP